MLNLRLILDGRIASVNKIYLRGRHGGVYLAPEVVQYRKDVKPVIQKELKALKQSDTYEGGLIVMKAEIWADFFTKGGAVRRVDVDNFAKQLIDSIFPVLGIDDSLIFDLTLKKKPYKGQPKCVIHLKEIPNASSRNKKNTKTV